MRIFVLIFTIIFTSPINAQISGQHDPNFKSALSQWLNGDDLAALTALSALANDGNSAAQVFLGRVSQAIHTHRHVTEGMDRKTRKELLRKSGGLSGKNWLTVAAKDVPLAAAFAQSKKAGESFEAIITLLDNNEVGAALLPINNLLAYMRNPKEIKAVLMHENLPTNAVYLRRLFMDMLKGGYIKQTVSVMDLRIINMGTSIKETEDALFMWEGFRFDRDDRKQFIPTQFPARLIDSPYYAPIKFFCEKNCGQEIPECMRAVVISTHSFGRTWISLFSPVEAILSTTDYHNSPRIHADVLRLLQYSATPANLGIFNTNQCVADLIPAR